MSIIEERRAAITGGPANGKPAGVVSESDQEIRMRKIGESVKLKLGTIEFNLVPTSFITANKIIDIVNESKKLVYELKVDAFNVEALEFNIGSREKFDALMFRGAQLIVFDAFDKNWMDKHTDIPPDEELEKVMPKAQLMRCSALELDNLFNVFYDLSKPVLPRKSFLKLGLIL